MSFQNEIEFCLKFLKFFNTSSESLIFSPSSLLNSLATVYVGANGNTAKQLLNVIGKNEDITAIIKYYSDLVKFHRNQYIKDTETKSEETESPLENLKLGDESDDGKQRARGIRGPPPRKVIIYDDGSAGFQLFIENQLIVGKNTPLIKNFNEMIKEKFDGKLKVFDFEEHKNEVDKVSINKSINDATVKKISEIIRSGDVDETSLILLNSTYFKEKWAIPFWFRKKTTFHSKIPREMDLITQKLCHISYNEGKDWKSVGIPYQGHNQWMFIILPNDKDELENLINKMDYEMFKECTRMATSRCVSVTIPAFEISGNYNLVKILQSLGITDLFDSTRCNLSKIINLLPNQKNHYFSEAIHEANIKVDEYGSGASEYTRDPRCAGCSPLYFKADYPFLYFILYANRETGKDNRYIEQEPKEIVFAGIYY